MTLVAWIGLVVVLVVVAVAWRSQRARRTSGAPPTPPEDRVGFSVYRPEEVSRGSTVTVLAYAHVTAPVPQGSTEPPPVPRQVEEDVSSRLAPGSLVEATTSRETAHFAPSDLLTFRLTVEGCQVSPPEKAVPWEAPFQVVPFEVSVPAGVAGPHLQGRLVVYQGIFVRGTVEFSLRLGAAAGPPQPVAGRAFDKVFPSYSHQDAAIVDYVEEAAKTLGHEYLRDVRKLRAGEVWSERIERLIDEADLFQLFWSSRSMDSPYVRQEWQHALGHRGEGFLIPVYWEDPLPGITDGRVPPELNRLHFHRLDVDPGRVSGASDLHVDKLMVATPQPTPASSPVGIARSGRPPIPSPPPRAHKGWGIPRSVWMSAALVVLVTVPLGVSLIMPRSNQTVALPPPPPEFVTVAVALAPLDSLSVSQESDLSARIAAELGVSSADVVLQVIDVGDPEGTDPEELRARAGELGARYLVTAWADTLRPELMTLYDFRGGARMPRDSVPRVDTIR